ncbi:MAG TPA: AI-2E family transporter [Desulfobacterales bacterium]|nr:AI-2E family transporter [Desulfobacterales bacterium]
MRQESFNKGFVLLLLLFISALFLAMIWQFLMTLIMAGIFSALFHPLYRRLQSGFGGRSSLAAGATLFLIVFLVLLPLAGFLGLVTSEALKVGQAVKPWIQKQISEPAAFSDLLEKIPFYDHIIPYKETILIKSGEMVGRLSSYLINSLSSVTVMTAQLLFLTFILLYTMFFFFVDGENILKRILHYLPLPPADEARMLDRFTSVTRATLKGMAVIGILQGGLAGAAFAAVGIPSSIFWGTVMIVMSIIPGIGTAIVWGPAAIILAMGGRYTEAAVLGGVCAVAVGSVDNFLRPCLVGKDTKMHELMVFFGTLGGIMMFGVAGIIIGPIVAALLVTVWEIYGVAFQDVLPGGVAPSSGEPPQEDPRILLAREDQESERV